MITKYYSCGSESEKEGLTLATATFDDDGNLIAGFSKLYKQKEITKKEYDAYQARLDDPAQPKGVPARGLLNAEGVAALKAWEEKMKQAQIAKNEEKIALSVKKIKKLLQLEVIEQGDVDTEIKQQGMTEFKDEIKRRLNQN